MKYAILFLSTCLLMSACGKTEVSDNNPAATSAPQASQQPVYRVLTEQSYPPFIMHMGIDKVEGFEYDLLTEIAKRQGFEVKFSPYTWQGLFDTLDKGEADIVSSGITVTEERKQKMSFSDPYFETETVLLLSKNSGNLQKFIDMRGKRIGVKAGTFQEAMVTQHGGESIYADSSWLSVKSTIGKQTAATLGDFGVLSYFANKYPEEQLKVVKDPTSEKEQLAFVVKKDNVALQNKLNLGLKQLKTDGTYQQLYQKWFGSSSN